MSTAFKLIPEFLLPPEEVLQVIERAGRGRLHRLMLHAVALLKARGGIPDHNAEDRFFSLPTDVAMVALGAPLEGDPRTALRDKPFSLGLFLPPRELAAYVRWPFDGRSFYAAPLTAGEWQNKFLRLPLQSPPPPAERLH